MCKKSCQPVVDELTDIHATKSTAEQPLNPTVPTQPLEAEHSASPSQSSIDIHLHITEPKKQLQRIGLKNVRMTLIRCVCWV